MNSKSEDENGSIQAQDKEPSAQIINRHLPRAPSSSSSESSDNWLTTYLDVMTLLLTFMVLMISNADFRQNLVQSLNNSVIDKPESIIEGRTLPVGEEFEQYLRTNNMKGFVKVEFFENQMQYLIKDEIVFDFESYEITQRSRDLLDKLFLLALSKRNFKIQIVGHANDYVGAELNMRLSMNRALAVSDFLLSRGLDADRLSVTGYGSNGYPPTNAEQKYIRHVNIVIKP